MPNMRALVTGAGGFIGSHVTELLVRRGWDVRALVRYSSHDQLGALAHAAPELIEKVEVVAGDLRDDGSVRAAVDGCDVVLHLGAVISIPYSYRAPREVVETNIIGTLNVLCAVRDFSVRRLVHTSTSEVYGSARTERIDEAHVLQGQSPYSASKIGADKLAEAFHRSFDTPVVTLRPFNTYGPRQSPRAVIPTILSAALADRPVRLGSLHPTRDFTFVTDTADAFVRAATADGVDGDTIHLGVGTEVSIGEIVRLVGELVGRDLPVVVDDERIRPADSEVTRLLSDPARARERLGWAPTVPLMEGLRRTADWLAAGGADWFRLPGYAI
jgi:NAD dependent epimerase/dehydratase